MSIESEVTHQASEATLHTTSSKRPLETTEDSNAEACETPLKVKMYKYLLNEEPAPEEVDLEDDSIYQEDEETTLENGAGAKDKEEDEGKESVEKETEDHVKEENDDEEVEGEEEEEDDDDEFTVDENEILDDCNPNDLTTPYDPIDTANIVTGKRIRKPVLENEVSTSTANTQVETEDSDE